MIGENEELVNEDTNEKIQNLESQIEEKDGTIQNQTIAISKMQQQVENLENFATVIQAQRNEAYERETSIAVDREKYKRAYQQSENKLENVDNEYQEQFDRVRSQLHQMQQALDEVRKKFADTKAENTKLKSELSILDSKNKTASEYPEEMDFFDTELERAVLWFIQSCEDGTKHKVLKFLASKVGDKLDLNSIVFMYNQFKNTDQDDWSEVITYQDFHNWVFENV